MICYLNPLRGVFMLLSPLQFAVYSLDRLLPDDMVCLYLLQLVECIKYDLYLDCALTRFVKQLIKLIEYGIFGEGSHIPTNQRRENGAFSLLIGRNMRPFPENTVLYKVRCFLERRTNIINQSRVRKFELIGLS